MPSHPLTDIFFNLGSCNMQTADDFASYGLCAPADGTIIEVWSMLNAAAADAELSVDIVKNGVDTTFDLIIPNGTANNVAIKVIPTGTINVSAGDLVRFRSDGDNTASSNLSLTAVLRMTT